ncbi:MAG TPA: SRPBCC domain-containing protein [Thermoplasmata archaeon]|nr:SRPBCC domain-containing protein [Thermoplasmata archaeon]
MKIARDFDFPRESVFRMFTDAKKAVKFWGPEGSVKLVFELDPRPGGALRIHDRHSDGVTSKTTGNVLEIVVPERLVFRSATAIGDSSPPFEALQTLTFEALGPSKTRVTALVKVLALGSFPAEVEALEGGFEGGWGQTFDMLQRELV